MKHTFALVKKYLIMAVVAIAPATVVMSCLPQRALTYEDGEFDDGEYREDASEAFQLNSEIDNDDQERY